MSLQFRFVAFPLASLIALAFAAPHTAFALTSLSVPTDGTTSGSTSDLAEQIQVPITADTSLDSFQFSGIGSGGNITFQALVYQFDPTTFHTVGPALYTSPLTIATSGFPLQDFAFSTGDLLLAPGEQILLDLHQKGFGNVGNLQMASTETVYANSEFRILNTDGITWSLFASAHELAFQATFSAPEPASLSVLALAALPLLTRRRHRPVK